MLIGGGRTALILSCFLPFYRKFVLETGLEGIVTVVLSVHGMFYLLNRVLSSNDDDIISHFFS